MPETIAQYKVTVKANSKQAEKTLRHLDELMIEFENSFPNVQVEVWALNGEK